ncbi:MAG: TIGR01212 family radical SAM protein, partial [Clostridiales bacterium]|nr:TIGR01212 family radical SAM protein [Clostridiales bacterium]
DKRSGDFAGNSCDDIQVQFEKVKEKLNSKWDNHKFIPYFQAGTNTYADFETLKEIFEKAIRFDNVVGIAVATRADCITEEIADFFAQLSKDYYVTVELGLQTVHDKTANLINRCHSYDEFLTGYNLLKSKGIKTCIHVINGLPYETREMMMKTAKEVAKLHPHSVKLHLLHILKGTKLERLYNEKPFSVFALDEYASLICDQLEVLPNDVVIQRITGDGAKADLVAPLWSMDKFRVMNEIDKEMLRRNTVQGAKCF